MLWVKLKIRVRTICDICHILILAYNLNLQLIADEHLNELR